MPIQPVRCTVNTAANSVAFGEGGRFSGAFYRPSGEGSFPAVLVLHTRGGFNDHVRSAAALLAPQGFVTLAPDYFTPLGVTAQTFDLRSFWVLHTEGALEVMAQALECLKVQPFVNPQHLGAVGFSLGGYFTFILANRSDIKGVVSYYGAYHGAPVSSIPTRNSWPEIVAQVRAPALILHGDSDSTIPLFRAEGVRRLMEERSKPVEMVVYPGVEHAFDQVGTPTYSANATSNAHARTLTFLNAKFR